MRCFVKQLGANVWGDMFGEDGSKWPAGTVLAGDENAVPTRHGVSADARFRLANKKGGDPDEWPADLRRYRDWHPWMEGKT